MYKAVLWDFGGVITSSPFEAFNRFEENSNLPKDFIRQVNSVNPETNAWAQLESNQITLSQFDETFAQEALSLGQTVRGQSVLNLLAGEIRPEMIRALKLIKTKFKIACITNNVKPSSDQEPNTVKKKEMAAALSLFDLVVESSKAGIRKPDPRIYQMTCEALNILPTEAIFLDDLGINLKPARALGMTTIKVAEAGPALETLSNLLDMDLN
ncbi:MAG: putative hydrolase of the HAD superfamily [Candidatus Azotimanducaceae bacterium]|jgi:putative hydrolase of the HAD superfamily